MKTYVLILAAGLSAYAIGRVHGYHDGYDGRGAQVGLLQAERESAELRLQSCLILADLAHSGALAGFEKVEPIRVPIGSCSGVTP